MIGPTLHRDTRPKLSSWEYLSLLIEDTPTPSARIKGTVMGPVVTPPESNPTGINVSLVKYTSPKVMI